MYIYIYSGLAKKKKLAVWSPHTVFYIKVHTFEILTIGKKIDFSLQKGIQNPVKHLRWSFLQK